MEKKVIIEGDEKMINVIMKENKFRVSRGLVKFTEVKERGKRKFDKETGDTDSAITTKE